VYLEQETDRLAEDLRLLSLVDVFEPLSFGELEEVFRGRPRVRLGAGKLVYVPNDLCESLFVLERGRVRLFKRVPGGREYTLAVLEGGTVFGEEVLASRRTRGAYAECVEEAEISVLGRGDLERLILDKPEVGLRLASLLAERLDAHETRLADLALKEVAARLAGLILLLVESEGLRTRAGYKVPNRYTHHQLGTMIGANREAVTRAFSQLREIGAVETENRTIEIPDIEALQKAAEGVSPVKA
jgi:CRP-like cAMP-binding protein